MELTAGNKKESMTMNVTRLFPWFFCLAWPVCLFGQQGANVSEREVVFKGEGGTSLAGTFQFPEESAGSKVPALVLLAGSGPTDRDGNQPPMMTTDLLKQIAQALAKRGVATLRFDKRGMYANAAELPKERSEYGDFFAWENFVGDAAASYRFLREQPEVDPARVGLLGHSEGGLLALAAARAPGAEAPPAVLILVSTPGRPIEEVIADQLRRLLKQQGATPEQADFFLTANHRISGAIRDTGQVPLDVPAGLAALYPSYLGKFLKSELAVDPCQLAVEFRGPILIVNGEEDTQVSPQLDALALDRVLKGRPNDDHALVIVPNASHNLKIIKGPEDVGVAGEVPPDVLDRLGAWTVAKLGHGSR